MSADTPNTPNKPLADRLVGAAKELGLPPKTEEVIRKADDFIADAVQSVGTFTAERREQISGFLDKAERTIDEKTDGKYADKVGKARAQAEKGVAKLAEQGKGGDASAPTPTYPTDPTGDAAVGQDSTPGQDFTPAEDPAPGSPS